MPITSRRLLTFEMWFYLLPFTFCLLDAPSLWAKNGPLTDDEVTVRTEGAHHLLLPKDWPVEQKDGRIAPAPIEEYLSMKFNQVKEAFTETDRRLAALEQRIEALERDHKALQKRLRVLEERAQQQEVTNGDTTPAYRPEDGAGRQAP